MDNIPVNLQCLINFDYHEEKRDGKYVGVVIVYGPQNSTRGFEVDAQWHSETDEEFHKRLGEVCMDFLTNFINLGISPNCLSGQSSSAPAARGTGEYQGLVDDINSSSTERR